MKRQLRWTRPRVALVALVAQALLLAALASAATGAAQSDGKGTKPAAVPGEIIVGFRDGVTESERDSLLAAVAGVEDEEFEEIEAELADVDPEEVDEAITVLELDYRVKYAEPNYLLFADTHGTTPNDPSVHELWAFDNFGQTVNAITGTVDADIDAREAWSKTTGSGSVTVGVIDSGVDFGHPDLGGSMATSQLMWVNPGENCGSSDPAIACAQRTDGVDSDGNGYTDDWRGWDFVNSDNNPFDDNGHGTHVSGTIGAIGNNGTGVVGVNWTTKIMALKFLDAAGSGSTASAVSAVLYAGAKGAAVTNNSWGGGGFSQALQDAIADADAKGSLFVAAAGNSSVNNDTNPHYPSSYDVPNVISVAATDSKDAKASFSNWGRKTVDLGAPGANIYSTYNAGSYLYANGTSMATPHVAGAAALAKARFPGASDLGLKALIFGTVDPKAALSSSGSTPTATGGRLNANGAVSCVNAPQVWIDAPAPSFTAGMGDPLPVKVIGTNCADTAGVTVTAGANGSSIALTPRGDGLYTGTYTPTTAGSLTISASATVGTTTATRSVSGTVVQNYRYEDASYSWIDATAGGTKLSLSGDDSSVSVSLPFSFTFYGQAFTSMRVSSNGFVNFGGSAATQWLNSAIPNTAAPNGFVAPLWDDLSPQRGNGVWRKTVGTSPNRKIVIQWSSTPRYPNIGNATFEVVLEEGTNDIVFQYQDVDFGNASYNWGASATIGVENLAGTLGKQFSYDQAVLQPYQGLKAIRFTTKPGAPIGDTPPTASNTSATTNEDTAVAVTLSGSDAQQCELGFSIVSGPTKGTLGAISSAPCTAGSPNNDTAGVTYTPSANFAGTDSFTYTVNDGFATSATATVTITVAAVNDAPVAVGKSASTSPGTAVTISLSATDVDTCDLIFLIVAPPANGTLSTVGPAPCTPGNPNADSATVTYTPNAGFTGTDSFTYKANDGALDSNVATASVTVQAAPTVAAPSNLQASPEEDLVDLTWTASATAGVTYTVYRGAPSCATTSAIASGLTATSYRDDGLAPGTYCYLVKAVKSGAESAASNTQTVQVTGGD